MLSSFPNNYVQEQLIKEENILLAKKMMESGMFSQLTIDPNMPSSGLVALSPIKSQ
jgi:hypothetical protein